MTRLRLTLATALLAGMTGVAGARADPLPPLTPDQSASLDRALTLLDEGMPGADPTAPVGVAPADGYYDLTFPVSGWMSARALEPALDPAHGLTTARATLDPAGLWHLDRITLPSPLGIGDLGDARDDPVQVAAEFGAQEGGAVIDPTLKNPSSSDWRAAPTTLRVTGANVNGSVAIDQLRVRDNINPSFPGRADFASVVTADRVSADFSVRPNRGSDAAAVKVKATLGGFVATTQSANLDIDRVMALAPRFADLASHVGKAGWLGKLSKEQRAEARDLLASLRNLSDGARQTATLERLSVSVDGQAGSLDKLRYSLSLAAPDGKVDTRLRLELDGLAPPLPAGFPGDLMPRRVVLAPSFSGVAMDDVFDVVGRLIDNADPRPGAVAADVEARLAKAPATVGIDELSFDLGPARVTAKGEITAGGTTAGGPGELHGSARIEASGLDDLVSRAGADPALKRALPVLILARALGDQQDDLVVWNLRYEDGKFTVNGTDFSALLSAR